MRERQRTAAYAKDEEEEALIGRLNTLLAPAQAALEAAEAAEPRLPVVFIIGAMRSGTTLVSQLLAQDGAFGYVCNVTARFWAAPGVGAMIGRALRGRRGARTSFESRYGVTSGLDEPHEFGYFWTDVFGKDQETHALDEAALARVDGAALRSAVASMEAAHGLPMTFKNNTWCTLQAAYLADLFPTSVFVVCRRHPLYVAQSVFLGRMKRYGDRGAWWSIRPGTFHEIRQLPPHEQVVRQVLDIENEMDCQLDRIAQARIVEADYEELCADPSRVVAAVRRACSALGGALADPIHEPPPSFESTNRRALPAEDWTLLVDALRKHRPDLVEDPALFI